MLSEILINAHNHQERIYLFFRKCPYYPQILSVFMSENELWTGTIKRVFLNGIWYDWQFLDMDFSKDTYHAKREKSIQRLVTQVYLSDVYGKVDPAICDMNGVPIFKESKIQISEQDRLLKYTNKKQKNG